MGLKKCRHLPIAIIVVALLSSFFVKPADSRLRVNVKGISNRNGTIALLLFRGNAGFPSDPTKAIGSVTLPISDLTVSHLFTQLPAGEYAVTVMHDENKNGKLDTNLFGIPEEGIGVSNNALNMFGPPVFQECAIMVREGDNQITIELDY